MKYVKVIDNKLNFFSNPLKVNNLNIYNPSKELLLTEGYKEYVEIEPPVITSGFNLIENFIISNDKIMQTFELISREPTIEELKLKLSETDYKIIKCMEYQLTGKDLPYNIIELHLERQSLRDEINNLQKGM